MIALSNSIHLYARPDTKEKFLEFFTSILGLEAVESSEVIHVKLPAFSYPSPKHHIDNRCVSSKSQFLLE